MNDKGLEDFVELLYPYFLKKLKKDGFLKNAVKRKNATVVSVTKDANDSTINQNIEISLPYDTTTFTVLNKTGEELTKDDLICIEYCIDLKNAVAVYKVN